MLIDADLASNNGGWQWSCSTGTDAQPYFRIFNPVLQGKRFDPDARFVTTWVPELRALKLPKPGQLHEVHLHVSKKQLDAIGYLSPIVDHAFARDRALAAFKAAFK